MSTIESKLDTSFNPSEFRRVGMIVNPFSGGRDNSEDFRQKVEEAGNYLHDQGFDPVVVYTAGRGDATDLADQFKRENMDAIVSCGGDGLDSEIVQSLAGSDMALISLDLGTVNILPHSLGYRKRDPIASIHDAVGGTVYRMDLGVVQQGDFLKYYTSVFGGGIDASITRQVEEQMSALRKEKKDHPPKRLLFTGTALRELVTHPRHEISLYTEEGDGDRWDDTRQVLVTNLPYYGGMIDVRSGTSATDEKLEATVFRAKTLADVLLQIPKTLFHLHEWPGLSETQVFSNRHYDLTVYSQDPFEVHTDAENLDLQVNNGKAIEVFSAPKALLVVAPRLIEGSSPERRQKQFFSKKG